MTTYTCPMHPEMKQEGPSACPLCGMDLEPSLPVEEAPLEWRPLAIAAFLTLPVMIVGMGHLPDTLFWQFLFTTAVLGTGWTLWERTWDSFRNRSPNMFTLISLGFFSAYFYSLWSGELYFEAAAVITTITLIGQ